MSFIESLGKLNAEDFVSAIPGPTGAALVAAYRNGQDLTAMGLQLSMEPVLGISPRGNSPWPPDMFARLISETRLLLCTDDPSYTQLREELRSHQNVTAKVVLSLASGAIGSKLGFAAALTVPFLATIFGAALKLSLSAWCKSMNECSLPLQTGANQSLVPQLAEDHSDAPDGRESRV